MVVSRGPAEEDKRGKVVNGPCDKVCYKAGGCLQRGNGRMPCSPEYRAAQTIIYKDAWIQGRAIHFCPASLASSGKSSPSTLVACSLLSWECQSNFIPTPILYQAHHPGEAHLVFLSHDWEFLAEKHKMGEVYRQTLVPAPLSLRYYSPEVCFFLFCLRIWETL